MSAPKFSVITVVRNGQATMRRTIDSVLNQKDADIEYIVIDGASTDGTVEIIREYGDAISQWVSEKDQGIYDAMNKGLSRARGDWVLFLGCDDALIAPLKVVGSAFAEPDSVYYGNVILESSGDIYAGRFSQWRLMQQNICHQAIFYPRSVYKSKPYDTGAGVLADHKYNIEVWGSGTPFRYIECSVSRFNDTGASANMTAYFEPIKLQTIRASFGLPWYLLKRIRTMVVKLVKARRL